MTPFAATGMIDTMPNAPKTPVRTVRVPDDEWEAVQRIAAERGIKASDVARAAIREYIAKADTSRTD